MISELIVKNVGGIMDASLNFRGRFIVITGESGAGKSSLVRALELASGKRAQSSQIRAGAEEAEVQAVLEMDSPISSLPEDIQPQEGFMVVRRLVSATGRARSYLQDRPVPLNTLNLALSRVIAIQSQFAQLGLLEPLQQVELLDNSGGSSLQDIKIRLFQTVRSALEKERKLLEMARRRRLIETQYQGGESFLARYSRLNPGAGSAAEWENEMNRVSLLLNRKQKIRAIYDRLHGGTSGNGLASSMEDLCGEIKQIMPDEPAIDLILEKVIGSIQEVEDILKRFISKQSEQELMDLFENLENRLGILRKLMRFAKVDTVEGLIDYAANTKAELDWLKDSRINLTRLQDESSTLKTEVSSLALSLREARKTAAKKLERSVNETLLKLAMEGLSFGISMTPLEKVRYTGADDISFFLTDGKHLNGPVARIASGGELSRILLSLQLASSDDMIPDVLVFDEVEAGLGGRAAVLAGYALKELSTRCQVLLITHEASIAALADQHFKVERDGDISKVVEVDKEQRIIEIARMLAGNPRDPEAISLARSLLANDQK